jgi:hypothetical protein
MDYGPSARSSRYDQKAEKTVFGRQIEVEPSGRIEHSLRANSVTTRMDFEFSRPELASSSPLSSPTASTRRFSQYKSRTSSSSIVPARPNNKSNSFAFQIAEPPQKLLWKERVRQQVAARARQERQKRHERGRSEDPSSDASSEADPAMDDDNPDDLDDEVCIYFSPSSVRLISSA